MTLEYKDNHPCVKPSMLLGHEDVLVKTVRFGLFTTTTTQRVAVYEQRHARWTCPECGAMWSWLPMPDGGGFWMCDYRPEKWVTQ